MGAVSSPSTGKQIISFVIEWAPRTIAVIIGGYYGLGIAYELGLMALIDQIAIQVFKHFLGYAGIGALMPTFQWYSAWAVRITIGLGLGFLYDLTERCALSCWARFYPPPVSSPQTT